MTERLQRLVKNGYVIFETKSFIVLGMYSKNVEHPIKKIFPNQMYEDRRTSRHT